MPYADVGDLRIHYVLEGPASAPPLVLAHALGTGLSLWDPQARALAGSYRVLRYDARGHGRTSVTEGPYAIAQLARDAIGLMDALTLGAVHFCGLSLGGLVGMWLAAHAPARVRTLALCNTAAQIGTTEAWNARIGAVQAGGMAAVRDTALERWFRPGFGVRAPETLASARAMLEETPAQGYAGCCADIRDGDQAHGLAAIAAPTLVIAGRDDPATPPADGRRLAGAIAGARYVELEAAHLSNLEDPDSFTTELARLLAG